MYCPHCPMLGGHCSVCGGGPRIEQFENKPAEPFDWFWFVVAMTFLVAIAFVLICVL